MKDLKVEKQQLYASNLFFYKPKIGIMNWTIFTKFSKLLTATMVVLLLTAQLGFAQITLTQANAPVEGDVFEYVFVDATGISPGAAGADVTWDFSDLTTVGAGPSGDYADPATTAYASNFPTATLAEVNTGSIIYYEVTATEMAIVGSVNLGATDLIIDYHNPSTQMQYPFTYNSTFTDEGGRTYATLESRLERTVTADAYGTLILPIGTIENTLRVTSVQTLRDTVPTDPFGYFEQEITLYEWFVEDRRDPVFTQFASTVDDNGTITNNAGAYYANIDILVPADEYGYSWDSSADGAICEWIDITTIGTLVPGLADDNFVGPFDMGIDFQYYWTTESEIYIGSNGYVSFDGYNISSMGAIGFPNIPNADAFNNLIAPLMCDLTFATNPGGTQNPGRVYTWSNNVDMFVVTYLDVPLWTNNANQFVGSNTFQIVFNSADKTISYNYLDVEAAPSAEYIDSTNPVVVGIENISGDIGIQISSNGFPADNSCYHFFAPDVPLIDVVDATPSWNHNEDNGGFFLELNTNVELTTNIVNVGSVDVPGDIDLEAQILNSDGGEFLTLTETISGVPFGESALVTFSDPFPAFIPDTYTYRVALSNGDDINPGNDITETEMVVVEVNPNGESPLAYVTSNIGAPGVVSWAGANGFDDGAGIYVEPPYYPAEVVGAEFLILPPGGAATVDVGFRTQVVAPHPVTNAPSAVLASEDVPVFDIMASNWNRVDYTDAPIIEEGGFYVSWLMEGTGIALGTDDQLPISRRAYEILSNTWAPYRSVNVEDLYIRVFIKSPEAEGIGDPILIPITQLSDPYPNPTDGMTQIHYNLPQNSDVTFSVVNTLGQEVLRQNHGTVAAGGHIIDLDTSNLPSGTYVYTLFTNGQKKSKRMVVVK